MIVFYQMKFGFPWMKITFILNIQLTCVFLIHWEHFVTLNIKVRSICVWLCLFMNSWAATIEQTVNEKYWLSLSYSHKDMVIVVEMEENSRVILNLEYTTRCVKFLNILLLNYFCFLFNQAFQKIIVGSKWVTF